MTGATPIERSGFVAVTGRANAGKSTLVNRIVGEHVAIVSPVAQTTRRVVRAVWNADGAQVVLVDLPGSQKPVDRLTERMQAVVDRSLDDVDAVLWVIDASVPIKAGERAVADRVFATGAPVVVAANKIDLGKPAATLEFLARLAETIGEREYEALVPISARTGDGVPELLAELAKLVPEGPPYYPPNERTDMRIDERISEYVREAFLARLREEIPHALTVEVEELSEDDAGVLHADCVVWTETASQVGIVVGTGGSGVRDAGADARAAIERGLDVRCYLSLRVKARRGWRNDDAALERWGL